MIERLVTLSLSNESIKRALQLLLSCCVAERE
jgi:hypothetical protein